MATRAFLGIDCGTQSTKALLMEADTGRTLAVGRAEHDIVERPDGTREQDPAWWTDATVAAVRQSLQDAGPIEVAGISVSGQQHGLVALDAADAPVRPAKLWNDTSTSREAAGLTAAMGGQDAVLAATGNLFLAGYTAPKIAWLREHEPQHYAASRRFCLPHDYLNLWLTGEFATEPGDASGTAYVDARTREYSDTVLAVLDGDRDWRASLPPIRDSLSVIGRLREGTAEKLGLPAGIPVAAGGGDNMCAAIGVGAVVEGPVVVSLGTSGTAFTFHHAPAIDPRGEAAAFCSSTGGWLPLVCTLNCTLATEWIRQLAGLDRDGFEAALRTSPPGARGLSFLPYLAGERTPYAPHAAASFAGLREEHDANDLVRAVTEGVTLGLAYALRALWRTGVQPSEITLVGGGSHSNGWAQLCADAFDLPIRREPEPEAAAIGAARQVAHVVDGAPLAPQNGAARSGQRFEPHRTDALSEADERLAALRLAAIG
ncbi:MAG TPA: xylulokinase [Candidatus Limnocylindria bacterium]|nr:xylulokinase [Candidatus Limnocylindria bacterium]